MPALAAGQPHKKGSPPQDLHHRLDQARYAPPLEGAAFHYGFNSNYLRKVVAYWRNQFDWHKQVEILNKYPHFLTTIEGEGVSVASAGLDLKCTGKSGGFKSSVYLRQQYA